MLEAVELGRSTSKKDYKALEPSLRVGLLTVQYELRESDFPVLILLGGDDGPGCGEVLNMLHEWMDPRYLEANVFEEISQEESERPRFWRYWRALPSRGRIAIFSREWTYRAVMDRARGEIDEMELERRLRQIHGFEKTLEDEGALVLKLWLHTSRDALRARARAGAHKRWYEDYRSFCDVSERVLRRTSRNDGLWNVVESTEPRYRDVTVAKLILHGLTRRLGEPAQMPPVRPSVTAGTNPLTVLDRVDLTKALSPGAYEKKRARYWRKLSKLSRKAHRRGVSTVLAFEGWDASGKGGAIRRLTKPMDAAHYRVIPIGAPTEEEKAHHYLWRFWQKLPREGHMVIFDRSWYGRVLVERLEGFASESAWRRAYAEINDFEEQLVERGILLVKFWLHISPDEQLRRFKARETVSFKKYKITPDDYRNREKWNAYEEAADEMVQRTSTENAPWHFVAANDKLWARIQVLKTVCREMARALD